MEELLIEEKAKAYDIALNKIKRLLGTGSWCSREELEYVFPELRESEDEKMMNQLHSWMKEFGGAEEYTEKVYNWLKGLLERQKFSKPFSDGEDERIRKWLIEQLELKSDVNNPHDLELMILKSIAWLEKQGEQKPVFEMKTPEESLGIDSDTYNKIVDECIYGDDEQKPDDKVEPKFNVGDWITNGIDFTFQIQSIEDNMYLRSDGYFIDIETADKKFKLWTIQDAKDGDVLVASDCSKFIYNGNITKSNSADFYIACTSNGSVVYGGDSEYGWEEKNLATQPPKNNVIL